MKRNSKYEKWVRWIDRIQNEVITLYGYRDIWNGLVQITEENPDLPPSHYYDFVASGYAALITLGIRRQIEISDRDISMAVLFRDIKENFEILSFELHESLYPDIIKNIALRDFGPYLDRSKKHIDPEIVSKDAQSLKATSEKVTNYVSKYLAHSDNDQHKVSLPTFREIHSSLDLLGELVKKYTFILKAENLDDLYPVVQFDWKAPFRVAWITKNE